ncbi:MAG: hypothetical protein MUC67_10085 [Acidobacteria bacterium]|jgi:hypothetical protein|nr:hypothetical protein [Acidobacteriota bacterium]
MANPSRMYATVTIPQGSATLYITDKRAIFISSKTGAHTIHRAGDELAAFYHRAFIHALGFLERNGVPQPVAAMSPFFLALAARVRFENAVPSSTVAPAEGVN